MQKGQLNSPGTTLSLEVWRADTILNRMRGLLGRPALQPGEGLLLTPCNSVHTLGMSYDLDLCFLDKQGKICKLVAHKAPRGFSACFPAHATLELAAGEISVHHLHIGMQLLWQKN